MHAGGIDKLIGQLQQHISDMSIVAVDAFAGGADSNSFQDGSESSTSGHGTMLGVDSVVDWGNAMFSLSEMREELERLREETGLKSQCAEITTLPSESRWRTLVGGGALPPPPPPLEGGYGAPQQRPPPPMR